ncbi:uncharacterized protein LOC116343816 [Contarinia nasturtii]|uniref:uncharacterized protein LOC116343816 n=1 Tax=Contarinia nasturtii TaxID=265458 RepID=UPI0012D3B169|nr:uncharacterized protein LOC116343816 [Contarinia nasturtii]
MKPILVLAIFSVFAQVINGEEATFGVTDAAYRTAVVNAADAKAARLRNETTASLTHRELMRRVKLFAGVVLAPDSALAGDEDTAVVAGQLVAQLAKLQVGSGLFMGGDNVESAPDSAFTINDVADTLELIRCKDSDRVLADIASALDGIVRRAIPAMLAGGVHTPNHRWELAAALARIHRYRPDKRLKRRAEEWLAEGIDIQDDGMYSERSANYAAYVSNPSLTAVADILGREDLRAIVSQNLQAFIGLIRPDGTVETVHSRRQDQMDSYFSIAPFITLYRRFAIEMGSGVLAWGAERALAGGIVDPETVLFELLMNPQIGWVLPPSVAPIFGRQRWNNSGLLVDANARRTLVIFGGSDYPRFRRIRSGLSNNPTFLQLSAGRVKLVSARLSRDFFGLGPFRADRLDVHDDVITLTEHVAGMYYLPLEQEHRRKDGIYALEDEGRFAAAMAFSKRSTEVVGLDTRVDVVLAEDGVEIVISTKGPRLTWSLELAFQPGGRFEGLVPINGGVHQLLSGYGRYVVGDDAIEFGPGNADAPKGFYHPGEDYTYLGGSDAVDGPRVYLMGRSPGTSRFTLRAVRMAA